MRTASKVRTTRTNVNHQPNYVFVLLTHKGKIVIGQANNSARRIAAINSGSNPALPEPLSINRVIGVKERTEERTLITTVKKFIDKYGENNVIVV